MAYFAHSNPRTLVEPLSRAELLSELSQLARYRFCRTQLPNLLITSGLRLVAKPPKANHAQIQDVIRYVEEMPADQPLFLQDDSPSYLGITTGSRAVIYKVPHYGAGAVTLKHSRFI